MYDPLAHLDTPRAEKWAVATAQFRGSAVSTPA
jgi:hypothetical protein